MIDGDEVEGEPLVAIATLIAKIKDQEFDGEHDLTEEQRNLVIGSELLDDDFQKLLDEDGLARQIYSSLANKFNFIDTPKAGNEDLGGTYLNEGEEATVDDQIRQKINDLELPEWVGEFVDRNNRKHDDGSFISRPDLLKIIEGKQDAIEAWMSRTVNMNGIKSPSGKTLGFNGSRDKITKYLSLTDALLVLKIANDRGGLVEPKEERI
jgi:hypothetical protein